MSLPFRIQQAFETLSKQDDDAFDLIEAALHLGKLMQPSANVDHFRNVLRGQAQELRGAFGYEQRDLAPLDAKISALQQVLCEKYGYHGDDEAFDDLDQMNVLHVMKDGCGSAVTLSVIFAALLQEIGWAAHVINFPGYCLLRLDEGGQRAILDPFHGCVVLDAYNLRQLVKVIAGAEAELRPEYYESLSPKTLFMRHVNAIKTLHLRSVRMEKAIEMSQVMTLLEPDSATFWREQGLLLARLDRIDEAIMALKMALKYTDDGDAYRHTEHILVDLRKKSEDNLD